jgi:hypothetical protein
LAFMQESAGAQAGRIPGAGGGDGHAATPLKRLRMCSR